MLEKPSKTVLRLRELKRLMFEFPELREAYSALHAGLRLNASFVSGRSILVTSSRPEEGKTTVASCLAIMASLSGQTALLIDGDLRRPWIGSAMGIADGIGLGEILAGQAEPTEAIHVVDLFDNRRDAVALSVMGAGGKSPEFLPWVDWFKARKTCQSIWRPFDLVLIDSPPILAAKDALLLAGVVDGILLVVGGIGDRHEVRRTKEQLESVRTPLIGAVFNHFDPKIHGPANQPYLGSYLADRR